MTQDWSGKPGAVLLDDGRTLSYLQYGDPRGFPCILVHDTPGSARSAGWQLHGLRTSHRVRIIAIDRLGWGASGHLHPEETADQARAVEADAISRLIRVLALRSAPVIGIGSGALVATAVAVAHPHLITGVSCLSPRLPTTRTTGPAGAIGDWRRSRVATRREHSLPFLPGIAEIGESEADWSGLLHRVQPRTRRLIGDRWRDADFRRAYQLDADATQGSSAYGRPVQGDTLGGVLGAVAVRRFDEPSGPVPITVFSGPDDKDAPAVREWLAERPGVRFVQTPEPVTAVQRWPEVIHETLAVRAVAV